ncbi:MAG: hypothetical protein COB42_06575 [Sulfurimonas sp.]|nr:MAG: hypothetical protein COB42_06575 [Sulfurimonas sp.]
MGKIDKEKEYIGALKVYLALITALLMGDISATVKLFQNDILDFTFWLGVITIVILAIIFMKLAKLMHKKINDLEDL